MDTGLPASRNTPPPIALAPMEGLVDTLMRDTITRMGGVDWCVTEFVRVTTRQLPATTFQRLAPELAQGSRTPAGTPMHLQLLGSDPACLADNAAFAAQLGAPVIDLNFGCPAKTVNRSRGGAVLLQEPELLHAIVREVRRSLPPTIPVTAKMRLGYLDTQPALDCARALAEAGASWLVVHARTKADGYRPPAHWEWIARIQDVVNVPVYANGEIWSLQDWRRCREISGVEPLMLGRGLIAQPDLARQIRAAQRGQTCHPLQWDDLLPELRRFWRVVRERLPAKVAPGRLKQWLCWLARNYQGAAQLFAEIRTETRAEPIDLRLLGVVLKPQAVPETAPSPAPRLAA